MAYWLEGAAAPPVVRQRRRPDSPHSNLIQTSRARLRIALAACLGVAVLLAYVVFPPQRVSVLADGEEKHVVARTDDATSLLNKAGVQRNAGDVVVRNGDTLSVERAVPVIVDVDGKTLAWRTRAVTVKGLLQELGIEVSPYDGIEFNGQEVAITQPVAPGPTAMMPLGRLGLFGNSRDTEGYMIDIRRAVPLTIVEDGQVIAFRSARQTVAQALGDAGVRLGPADEIWPDPADTLVAGQQVVVNHASEITVRLGDSARTIYTRQTTLRDALAEAGLTLGAEDRIEPSLDAAVQNGMSARLIRIAGRSFIEKDVVVKKTVFKPDEVLAGSNTRIVQGHDGVHLREYRIVIEDGVEKEKKLVREWDEPAVQDTVIFYAASTLRATGLPAGDLNVDRIERMYATWYNAASSGRAPTDPSYGMTATGVPVTKGIVAVDPRVIPLGTRLFIPGYGIAIAADTGGAIVGNTIDLGFPDGVVADWRTGWVDVFILAP